MKKKLFLTVLTLFISCLTTMATFHIDRVTGSAFTNKGGEWKELKANSLLSDNDSIRISDGASVTFHSDRQVVGHTLKGAAAGAMKNLARKAARETRNRVDRSGVKISSTGVSLRGGADDIAEILCAIKSQDEGKTALSLTRIPSADGATFGIELTNTSEEQLNTALFVRSGDGFCTPINVVGDCTIAVPAKSTVTIDGLEIVNAPELCIGVIGSNRNFFPSTLIGALGEEIEAVPVPAGCRAYMMTSME